MMMELNQATPGAVVPAQIADLQWIYALALNPDAVEAIARINAHPSGLVLIAGDEDSDISTTLNAMLADAQPRGYGNPSIGKVLVSAPSLGPIQDDIFHYLLRGDPETDRHTIRSILRLNPGIIAIDGASRATVAGAADMAVAIRTKVIATLQASSCVQAYQRWVEFGGQGVRDGVALVAGIIHQTRHADGSIGVQVVEPDADWLNRARDA